MCILSCCKERFEQICKQNDTINTHLIDRSISLLYLDIIPSKLVTTILIFQSFSCSATRLTCSHHCSDTILTTKLTGSTMFRTVAGKMSSSERGKNSNPYRVNTPPLKVDFSPLSGHSEAGPTQTLSPMTWRVLGVKTIEPITIGAFFMENNYYRLISAQNNTKKSHLHSECPTTQNCRV